MAKTIQYKFLAYEKSSGEQIFRDKEIICDTKAQYDANLPIAEQEAVPGTIEVSGEFGAEEPTDSDRIAELEEALAMLLSGVTE